MALWWVMPWWSSLGLWPSDAEGYFWQRFQMELVFATLRKERYMITLKKDRDLDNEWSCKCSCKCFKQSIQVFPLALSRITDWPGMREDFDRRVIRIPIVLEEENWWNPKKERWPMAMSPWPPSKAIPELPLGGHKNNLTEGRSCCIKSRD